MPFNQHSAFSNQHFTLHFSPSPPASICGLDFDPLSASADDRLDELAVGVLVAAIDELAERLPPIGSFIVNAGKIQRPERIVCGADDEETGESALELFEHIAQARSFKGGEVLACTAAEFHPAGTQLVGTDFRRRCADENDLFCSGSRNLAEQSAESRRSVAQPVRLPSPRPLRGKRGQVRLTGDRHCQRRRERIKCVISRDSGKVESLESPRCAFRCARPAEETRTVRMSKHGEDDIAPRVQIVNGYQKFTKSRLTEIVRQQFDVPAGEILRVRCRDGSRATNQIPKLRDRLPEEAR